MGLAHQRPLLVGLEWRFLLFFLLLLPGLGCKIDIGSDQIEWKLCHQSLDTRYVSFLNFSTSSTYKNDCFSAVVPGTALVSMLKNGLFKGVTDLFHDEDLGKIPDIYNNTDMYTFFWRAQIVNVSKLLSQCGFNKANGASSSVQAAYVHVRSLNYRASFFQNGKEIFPVDNENEAAVGMFHRWVYPLEMGLSTSQNDAIAFAILVKPPDYVGKPNCGQGGDHEIAKNAAVMQYTAGWDWVRATPDRNTGLWDLVELEVFEAGATVSITNTHVRIETNITSDVPPTSVKVAVSTRITLVNATYASSSDIFTVKATVQETLESSMSKPFPLVDIKDVNLPLIEMKSPKLWWPHTHHDGPNLYTLRLELFKINVYMPHAGQDGRLNSSLMGPMKQEDIKFGVRTFSTYIDREVTNGRVFLCNGEQIFLQGGNWIGTDQFLRYSTSVERYTNEVLLHKQMGLNLIRVWGGGITERPEFYDAADRLGILVLQEFWMTGDNNGRWAGSYSSPLDHDVYLACVKDVILMLRNHPSLLLWVGGNELYPAAKSPPADIAAGISGLISKLDPGRFYIPSSMSNYTKYDPEYALAPKDGPYGYLDPRRFDERNPGLKYWNGSLAATLKVGFQPEIGSSATPVYNSLLRFLHGENAVNYPTGSSVPSAFTFHQYLGFTDDQGQNHVTKYGKPTNMSEYCYRAQLAQYCQSKGLYEGFQRHQWEFYTGMIFWKTQSPWPSFRGYMYDSYLETTGGFWGVLAATEGGKCGSLHVQLGNWTEDLSIVIVNRGHFGKNDYRLGNASLYLSVQWFRMNGSLVNGHDVKISGSDIVGRPVYSVESLEGKFKFPKGVDKSVSETLYLRMSLTSTKANMESFNDYWMSEPSTYQEYADLGILRANKLVQWQL